MKTAVLSYSLTGNNEALAQRLAERLNTQHIRISEPKKRTYFTIAADILLGRTPPTSPDPQVLSE